MRYFQVIRENASSSPRNTVPVYAFPYCHAASQFHSSGTLASSARIRVFLPFSDSISLGLQPIRQLL